MKLYILILWTVGIEPAYSISAPLEGSSVVSRDGEHLFNRCERGVWRPISSNLWLMLEAGNCQVVWSGKSSQVESVTQGDFVWHPIGILGKNQYVALREKKSSAVGDSIDDHKVYLIDMETGVETAIMSIPYPWARSFYMAPAGGKLIIELGRDLVLFDFSSRQLTDLAPVIGEAFSPHWSADGQQIFFRKHADRNLYSYDLVTKQSDQLTDFDPLSTQLYGNQHFLSADGQSILALYSEPAGTSVKYSLWMVDITTKKKRKLVDEIRDPQDIILSPDNKMAYYIAVAESHSFEIFEVEISSLVVRKIPRNIDYAISILPKFHGWSDDKARLLITHQQDADSPSHRHVQYLTWLDVTTGTVSRLYR